MWHLEVSLILPDLIKSRSVPVIACLIVAENFCPLLKILCASFAAKTMKVLRGPGHRNQGTFQFNWKAWNFPYVPSNTMSDKNKAGYTTKNGTIKSLLVAYLLLAQLKENQVKPILENSTIFLIPCTLGTHEMNLMPSLQFNRRLTELVGLLFPVTLSYTKDNPDPDTTTLHDSFVLEANASVITSLDNKLQLAMTTLPKR